MRRATVGRRARARVSDGGPTSLTRPALSLAGLNELRALIIVGRANGRCEHCSARTRLVLEHAIARSQGGQDAWHNVWATCTRCHDQKHRTPFCEGRLLVDPLGDGRFRFRVILAVDKHVFLRSGGIVLSDKVGGRLPTDSERAVLERLGAL